jgi:hypothetical protein
MTATNDRSSNERQIRQLLEGRLKAIHTKDASAAMASSAPDPFEMTPPFRAALGLKP